MSNEIIGHYVSVDGTRIYYEECGEGVPLFCIHTAGACSIEYYEFLPIMAERGFRAIAVDLPGHGKSYPVNGEPFRVMHEYAEFVWQIINVVCDDKPVVVGCSIGGNMVTDLACHHSEEMHAALALEGAAFTPTFPNVNLYEHPHACPSWRDLMERAADASLYRPISEERRQEVRWMHRYAPQEIATGDLQCWVNHDVRDKLDQVSCPLLIFKGEADYYLPEQLLDDTVAGVRDGLAEKVVGKEMGHYPMFEQPGKLADICLDFLTRHEVPLEIGAAA
jgi:pimeloyl-ACP methyl ester carboxylesterase